MDKNINISAKNSIPAEYGNYLSDMNSGTAANQMSNINEEGAIDAVQFDGLGTAVHESMNI